MHTKCSQRVIFYSPNNGCAPQISACDLNLPEAHLRAVSKVWGNICMWELNIFEGGSQVFLVLFFNIGFTVLLHTEIIWQHHRWNLIFFVLGIGRRGGIIFVFHRTFLDFQRCRSFDKCGNNGDTSLIIDTVALMIFSPRVNITIHGIWLLLLLDYSRII